MIVRPSTISVEHCSLSSSRYGGHPHHRAEEDAVEREALCHCFTVCEKVVSLKNVGCCGRVAPDFFPTEQRGLIGTETRYRDAGEGYSTSRTCEIGLSMNSGITYQSIVYLVDKATL